MISHPHRTVFVHIPKTGGQSVESVFLNDLGLKWRDRALLGLRRNGDCAAGPERLAHLYGDEYVRLGHMAAQEFQDYTRFTVVRHPYDRVISEYRYRLKAQTKRGTIGAVLSFDDFLCRDVSDDHRDLSRHMQTQARYVQDGQGGCLIEHILRFETLAQDIAPLFVQVFGGPRALPHANRSDPVIAFGRDDLTAAQKTLLADRYRVDFEMFGYAR